MELRTKDHPEANGRTPQNNEHEWTFNFQLEDGSTLCLKMGDEGLKNLRHIILDQMIDENTDPDYNNSPGSGNSSD
jgi:hypothetical protein